MKIKTNIEHSIGNSLRRIMISEIETYAIDIVSIEKNDGIIHDDMLAHRLGLLPLKVIQEPEDEDDLFFTLEKQATDSDILIFSSDLKTDQEYIKLVYNDILITKLQKGQSIKLKGIIKKGTGKIHSKWSAACGISFCDGEFNIETTGSISERDLLMKSIDVLEKKLDNLIK